MSVRTYIGEHTLVCECKHTRVGVCTRMCIRERVCVFLFMCVNMDVYVQAYAHACLKAVFYERSSMF